MGSSKECSISCLIFPSDKYYKIHKHFFLFKSVPIANNINKKKILNKFKEFIGKMYK